MLNGQHLADSVISTTQRSRLSICPRMGRLQFWTLIITMGAGSRTLFLVIALGLDPAKGNPAGTWSLGAKDFELNGQMLNSMELPTVVIQEGGYRTRTPGKNARAFFEGLSGQK